MVGTQSDGRRMVLYNCSPRCSGRVAESLLEDYEGSVQTDYTGYNSVGVEKHLACGLYPPFEAHVGANKKGHAKTGLKCIKRLYRIEHELKDADLADDEFVVARR
jgi:hypothetical protein